jgi:hypothetical protein
LVSDESQVFDYGGRSGTITVGATEHLPPDS